MFGIKQFALRNGISRSKVFLEIKSGRLKALKIGRRTLITEEAEQEWRASLLPWTSSPPVQPGFCRLMALS